ncbi:MAG: LysE family translocator, partial [Pseudomonadota bacterium]
PMGRCHPRTQRLVCLMTFETWLAFAIASAVLLVLPGPTVLLSVSYAINHGRRASAPSMIGTALGDFVAMSVSLAGLGAVLIASSDLYTALKWIGAVYLVYLAFRMWRAPPTTEHTIDRQRAGAISGWGMMRTTFLVTVLNPKAIVFFVAFVPHFIDASSAYVPQAIVMVATFVALAAVNILIYTTVAAAAGRAIATPHIQVIMNRIGGSLLMSAGAMTALTGRPQS